MKLYTENQLRNAIAMGYDWCYQKHIPSDDMIDTFIEHLSPIELPSDEEIKDASIKYYVNKSACFYFEIGAKWMRDKIGGNK